MKQPIRHLLRILLRLVILWVVDTVGQTTGGDDGTLQLASTACELQERAGAGHVAGGGAGS